MQKRFAFGNFSKPNLRIGRVLSRAFSRPHGALRSHVSLRACAPGEHGVRCSPPSSPAPSGIRFEAVERLKRHMRLQPFPLADDSGCARPPGFTRGLSAHAPGRGLAVPGCPSAEPEAQPSR